MVLGKEKTSLEFLVAVQARLSVPVASCESRSQLLNFLSELISLQDLVR